MIWFWAFVIALVVIANGWLSTTVLAVLGVLVVGFICLVVGFSLGETSAKGEERNNRVIYENAAYNKGFEDACMQAGAIGAEILLRRYGRQQAPPRPKPKRPPTPWYLKTLGLKRGATAAAIKAAYFRAAKRAHPDVGGSDEAMQELNRARDAAMNEAKG